MKARPQGSDELIVHATPQRIWEILEDSQRLADWAPMVLSSTGTRETVGAVRECKVEFSGKRGRVVEGCVEAVPERRIAWMLQEDTFGFNRMLDDFGFSYELEPKTRDETLVRTTSYYEPKTILARTMNVLVMRRKFGQVRRRALQGLKQLAERRSVVETTSRRRRENE
jgi:uncharacterized protein YndB with AHSA1/START domain